MTIAKKVREYKAANPNATDLEIAKACGTSSVYVYQILRAKKAKKTKPTMPTEGQQVIRNEISSLNKKVEQLQNDIIGYRAVISYLQGRLDGLTV